MIFLKKVTKSRTNQSNPQYKNLEHMSTRDMLRKVCGFTLHPRLTKPPENSCTSLKTETDLRLNGLYLRSHLHNAFGGIPSLSRVFPESPPKRFFQTGQRQSGVSTPAEKPFIMLFTADFTNKNNALYNDGWIEVRHVSFGV